MNCRGALAAILLLCSCASAQSLPNKYAHDSLDGFHGLSWGTPVDSVLSTFGLIEQFALSPDSTAYTFRSSVVEVAGAPITDFQVSFFKNRFCGLTFETKGEVDFERVRSILRSKFGRETKTETYGQNFSWNSGASARTGEYNPISHTGKFTLCSWPMIQEMQAEYARFLSRPPNPSTEISIRLKVPDSTTVDSTSSTVKHADGRSISPFAYFGVVIGSTIIVLGLLLLTAWILFPILMFHRLSQIRKILIETNGRKDR